MRTRVLARRLVASDARARRRARSARSSARTARSSGDSAAAAAAPQGTLCPADPGEWDHVDLLPPDACKDRLAAVLARCEEADAIALLDEAHAKVERDGEGTRDAVMKPLMVRLQADALADFGYPSGERGVARFGMEMRGDAGLPDDAEFRGSPPSRRPMAGRQVSPLVRHRLELGLTHVASPVLERAVAAPPRPGAASTRPGRRRRRGPLLAPVVVVVLGRGRALPECTPSRDAPRAIKSSGTNPPAAGA